jgi:hypothetical protein
MTKILHSTEAGVTRRDGNAVKLNREHIARLTPLREL